jgi:hypothetical protein
LEIQTLQFAKRGLLGAAEAKTEIGSRSAAEIARMD